MMFLTTEYTSRVMVLKAYNQKSLKLPRTLKFMIMKQSLLLNKKQTKMKPTQNERKN